MNFIYQAVERIPKQLHSGVIYHTEEFELAALPKGAKRPRQRLLLTNAPLAHLDPATLALSASTASSVPATPDAVTEMLTRAARSVSTLHIFVDGTSGVWQEENTLLDSSSTDQVFRVEIDDTGRATVVFGDGTFGMSPSETATVTAVYRVGGGTIGNVAAGTLTQTVLPELWLDSIVNVTAATGGRDQETREHARRVGPASSHDPLVAVTSADYQAAAQSFVDSSAARCAIELARRSVSKRAESSSAGRLTTSCSSVSRNGGTLINR